MRFPTRAETHEIGLAVAAAVLFETTEDPELRSQAAAMLASVTATARQINLITPGAGATPQCTLFFLREEEKGPAKVALLPETFYHRKDVDAYEAARRYWMATGANLLLPGMMKDPWPEDVSAFVKKHTVYWWSGREKTPFVLRWANAALQNGPKRRDYKDDLATTMILMDLAEDKSVETRWTHEDILHVQGAIEDIWFEANQVAGYIPRIASKYVLRRTPLLIPIDVFRRRGDIAPMQALVWYLVKDPLGPKLTHEEAQLLLGFGSRSEVSTHLDRVSKATKKKGLPSIKPDPTLPPLPPGSMVVFDFVHTGTPKTNPKLGTR